MTRTSKFLCVFYALVAIAALYGTQSENLQYASTVLQFLTHFASFVPRFLTDMKANPASRSISIDIGLFFLAASALMVREARRIGVRFVWAYIVFASDRRQRDVPALPHSARDAHGRARAGRAACTRNASGRRTMTAILGTTESLLS